MDAHARGASGAGDGDGESGTHNIGALVLAVAGMVAAGAGLFALMLPFRVELDVPEELGAGSSSFTCDTPLASAFDDAGEVGGWFAHAPGTEEGVVLSVDGSCVRRSRTRASWGAVGLIGGLVLAGTQRRSLNSG